MENAVMNKPIYMEYLSELINAQLENRKPQDIPAQIDIDKLVQIAHENHIDYLILGSLLKLPLGQERIDEFRPFMLYSTMKTLQQVREVELLQDSFEKEGIRNQVLKGAVMKHIYPRQEMREMSDIDFMIYEDSLDHADRVMQSFGYGQGNAIKHHTIYKKNPYLVAEMHWSLYEQTVDKEQYLYYKNQFRAVLKEGKQYTYEFSKEDFYVYMISHAAKHFYENGCGIRNLLDVYIFKEKYGQVLDYEKISKELERCGITDFEYHISKLAYIWMKHQESTEFYNNLFLYMMDCGIYGKSQNGIWGQLAKQTSTHGKAGKLKFYFPPRQYMQEYYPFLEKWGILLPLTWCMRGIKGLQKESLDRAKMVQDEDNIAKMEEIYGALKLDFHK